MNEGAKNGSPYFTIEEMVAMQSYQGLDISADGSLVAYVERIADWDENTYVNRVWMYDTKSRRRTLLTPDAIGGSSPKWSQSGDALAYIRSAVHTGEGKGQSVSDTGSRSGSIASGTALQTGVIAGRPGHSGNDDKAGRHPQLFVKAQDFAIGMQVTWSPDGVGSYQWAPDGKGIYYLASREDKARAERKKKYGDIEYVDVDYDRKTLYYVQLEDGFATHEERYGQPQDLRSSVNSANLADDGHEGAPFLVSEHSPHLPHPTGRDHPTPCFDRPDLHVQEFAISADGTTIVFCAAPSPNFEDFARSALYVFDVAEKTVQPLKLQDFEGRIEGQMRFAPSGKEFAFTFRTGDARMFRNNAIAVFDLDSGTVRTLALSPWLDEEVSLVKWTQSGIVIEWQNRTNRWIERVEENGNRTPLVTGEGVMAFGSSVSANGDIVACIKATVDTPTDVFVGEERITQLRETFANHRVSQRRRMTWKSSDGTEIEGVLSVPNDFDESRRYPLLVVVHGGPTWASFPSPTQDKYYPIEQFVERGFIVLLPNYRGSSGYGEAFRSLNERNLGVGDYEDVVSGVEALVHAGYADTNRVGVMGWSQGGYISAFCTTFSRRFKAVSVGAGISNWVTYYVNTDIHPFTRHYLGDAPWNDMEVYHKTSPMTYITGAGTPTLIQHGDHDSRVPLPNAFELYQGLRDVGVDTKLVVFKGMQHGSDKPGWNRAILHQNYAWFCHHIMGDPLDGFWLE